ncbi:MAG: heparinase II/III family protein [Abditibacteriales bacterium]|nr:heparinase II/III family protein [Abditibacteriales bacterium]
MRRWKWWMGLAVVGVGLLTVSQQGWLRSGIGYFRLVAWENALLQESTPLPPVRWETVRVRPGHPRLHLTPENIAEQRRRLNPRHPAWEKLVALAQQGDAAAAGLCYQMTGERRFAEAAARSLRKVTKGDLKPTCYALAFDWAFPGWDETTRAEMVQRFVRLLGLREGQMPFVSDYCDLRRPLPSQTPEARWYDYYNWTFHSEDWADSSRQPEQYSPYLALAGHHPQATRVVQALWEMSFKDVTLFLDYLQDGAFWEGGYWAPRGKVLKMASAFSLLHSSTGLGQEAFPYLSNVGYFLLYQTDLATGQLTMPYGDSDPRHSREWQVRHAMLASNYFARNPYYQWYLNHLTHPAKPLEEAMWFDPRLPEQHPRSLPPTRLFPQSQVVMFRSGWEGRGDCIGLFKVGHWFGLHNHHDAGHFMLYKDGWLVGKAGFYNGSVPLPHQDTVESAPFYYAASHNTLALEPPGVTHGGQRTYRRVWSFRVGRKAWLKSPRHFQRGSILKFETTKGYDYVVADVAPAYPPENVKEFTRQVVFLRPGAMVIFDRVETAPHVGQKFLVHVVGQPRLTTSKGGKLLSEQAQAVKEATVMSQGSGPHVLVMRTLLPKSAKLRAVREDGKFATWRVEIAATVPQPRGYFLHFLYPAEAHAPSPNVQMSEQNETLSLSVRWGKQVYQMTFRKQGQREGRVSVSSEQ